jgi:arsenite methyltransferase
MSGCCGSSTAAQVPDTPEGVREEVRAWYGSVARRVADGGEGCCGPAAGGEKVITDGLYGSEEASGLPLAAVAASLGCGNPTMLADLREGEVVLDLGSGGGIDVLLSAKRVGPTGRAYGLDMTDEMLELARRNQAEAGIGNAEFIKGGIESIPLAAEAVDVVISNCVINLSPEKDRVFEEIHRVLRPGGRLAISDIVFRDEPPRGVREVMGLWSGCIGGALTADDYSRLLERTGFRDVDVEFTREYGPELADGYPEIAATMGEGIRIGAAFVRATKEGAAG